MHHSTCHSNTHYGAVSSRTVQVLNRFVTNLSHAISECSELLVSASLQPSSSVIREHFGFRQWNSPSSVKGEKGIMLYETWQSGQATFATSATFGGSNLTPVEL